MLYVYEFEVFEDKEDGGYIAIPFDLKGGTDGDTRQECLEMAADWLKATAEHYLMHNLNMPAPTIDNHPVYGGKIYSIVLDTDLGSIARLSKAQAARELGVSPGRITQLINAGMLETFVYKGKEYVTEASVVARKADIAIPVNCSWSSFANATWDSFSGITFSELVTATYQNIPQLYPEGKVLQFKSKKSSNYAVPSEFYDISEEG
ncbi:type II toxin-antitoxin system HicB family antitoxin [Lancefieldella rimae]